MPRAALSRTPPPSSYCVYLLESLTLTRTYTGCTNNLRRRLRQHNGELVGGARSTRGQQWRVRVSVHGFETQREALRFEYYSKRPHLLHARSMWPVPPALRRRVSGAERRTVLFDTMMSSTAHLFMIRHAQ